MPSLKSLNLEFNPFQDITPSRDSGNLVWAEMSDVREKLERSYNDCIKNNSRQMVLNWGPYGGGKTFSAYYFMQQNSTAQNLVHIYLRCPKDGAKSTKELFKLVIDDLDFMKICEHISFLVHKHGEEKLMSYLTPKAGREYAKAICLLASNDDDTIALLNRYVYAGLTNTELKKLGLAKPIKEDSDCMKFLTGILSCFAGNKDIYNGRVVLWIDEMEDLIYYSPKHYKIFSQSLRDLVDSINNGFLVFLNFTLADNSESTVEIMLGGAVWSRITRKIRFKEFTLENARQYSLELLDFAKINKNSNKPIDATIVDQVLSIIPESELTPREINKYFTSLISYVLENDLTKIDSKVYADWVQQFTDEQ